MRAEQAAIGRLEAEASAWIARLDAGHWSTADQRALREWCARSPAHRETLRRMCSTWVELDELSVLRQAVNEHSSPEPARLRWNGFWGVHAAFLVVFLGIATWWLLPTAPRVAGSPAIELYATRIGEQRTVVLTDHSTVRLNTNSLLEVDYRPDERRVRLVNGEALFEVAKDARRPFLVNAAGASVRAVGTRFSVRLQHEEVEVVVSEGAVTLARSGTTTNAPESRTHLLVVRPEQIAVVRDRTTDPIHVTTVDVHEVQRRLSWTQGVLEFDGEPLEKVIVEVSRYTPLKITIVDPELRDVPVGGRFKIGETRALFEVIEAGFGARVIPSKDGVLITRAHANHG
jgi:transmembrane sensor